MHPPAALLPAGPPSRVKAPSLVWAPPQSGCQDRMAGGIRDTEKQQIHLTSGDLAPPPRRDTLGRKGAGA